MGELDYTGRTAVPRAERTARPRGAEPPWGRESADNVHFPAARLLEFAILTAENADRDVAAAEILAAWDTWRTEPTRERYAVVVADFEHYLNGDGDHGFVLYITYSK